MKKLQVNGENTQNAESFTIMYKSSGDLGWNTAATVSSLPYNILGLNENTPYQVKIKKNCKSKPCIPIGGTSAQWVD